METITVREFSLEVRNVGLMTQITYSKRSKPLHILRSCREILEKALPVLEGVLSHEEVRPIAPGVHLDH